MADRLASAILIVALFLPLWFALGLIAPVRLDFAPRARRMWGGRAMPRVQPSAEAALPSVEAELAAELEATAG